MNAIAILMKENGFFDAVSELASTLAAWRERERQRHDLGRLDARLRRDIGVTAEDVSRELRAPLWKR
jgi:uncharacterized protein YjiS (DUF1127 family)